VIGRLLSVAFCIFCVAGGCGKASEPAPARADADAGGPAADSDSGTVAQGDSGPLTNDAGSSLSLRLLFIGNSYTQVNDLPATLRSIATSSKVPPTIETETVAVGGATLEDLYKTTNARAVIQKGGFSHVVLQGQSVEPLAQPTVFQQYATLFATDVRAIAAIPTFYETWARREGDPLYTEIFSGGSPAAMQDGLLAAYDKAGKTPGDIVVHAGEAWRATLAQHPEIVLFQVDGSHPTMSGTYLTACVFYDKLAGHAVPESAAIPAGVGATEAAALRALAATIP